MFTNVIWAEQLVTRFSILNLHLTNSIPVETVFTTWWGYTFPSCRTIRKREVGERRPTSELQGRSKAGVLNFIVGYSNARNITESTVDIMATRAYKGNVRSVSTFPEVMTNSLCYTPLPRLWHIKVLCNFWKADKWGRKILCNTFKIAQNSNCHEAVCCWTAPFFPTCAPLPAEMRFSAEPGCPPSADTRVEGYFMAAVGRPCRHRRVCCKQSSSHI